MTTYQCEQLTKYYYYAFRDGWERHRNLLYALGAKKDSIRYEWDEVERAAAATIPTDEELASVEDWLQKFKRG